MADYRYLDEVRTQELITEIKTRLGGKVTQYTTMPAVTAGMINTIVLYIGPTDENYTQGDFYKANTVSLEWEKITYNVEEITQLIAMVGRYEPIKELPTNPTEIRTNTIYLLPITEEITGYTDETTPNGPVYVPTDEVPSYDPETSDPIPAYNKYVYNETFQIYQYSGVVMGEEAEPIKTGIENNTLTEVTVTAQVRGGNTYIEYINPKGTVDGWEKIGTTDIDLDKFVKYTDLVPITSAELTAMWGD